MQYPFTMCSSTMGRYRALPCTFMLSHALPFRANAAQIGTTSSPQCPSSCTGNHPPSSLQPIKLAGKTVICMLAAELAVNWILRWFDAQLR